MSAVGLLASWPCRMVGVEWIESQSQCVCGASLVIKAKTTGGTGSRKWQCGANCQIFKFYLFIFLNLRCM